MASYRILIVDDEPDLLTGMAEYFSRRGETVTRASNVAEACALIAKQNEPFDALLSDMRMPDGSGLDIVRAQQIHNKACLCFLMTGSFEDSAIPPNHGVVKIFFKPFSVAALHRDVRAALAGTRRP